MSNVNRRTMLPALLTLVMGGIVAAPTKADINIKITRADGKKVAYVISYTPAGEKEARHFGVYETSEDASAVATHLQRDGHTVHIAGRVAEIPTTELPDESNAGSAGICTLTEAQKCFSTMAAQQDIAFAFPMDGCYARAHLMCRRMQLAGYRPGKVWSFANGQPLYAQTTHHPDKFVTWGYHVAPALSVKLPDNRIIIAIVDPSLFDRLVTVAQWRDAQKRPDAKYNPIIRLTGYGAAPFLANGYQAAGHGYWPAADPRDPDTYSANIMKKYKPFENRRPPADLFASR